MSSGRGGGSVTVIKDQGITEDMSNNSMNPGALPQNFPKKDRVMKAEFAQPGELGRSLRERLRSD